VRTPGIVLAATLTAVLGVVPLAAQSAQADRVPTQPTVADAESPLPKSMTRAADQSRPSGDVTAQATTGSQWLRQSRAPALRATASRTLKRSALAAGRHPSGRQPDEPYMPQVACYAGELPGVRQFRDLLLTAFPRPKESLSTFNISRGCNVPGVSEHEEGRALDWEARVTDRTQDSQARTLLHWLTKRGGYHAKRFGIMYMIYDQRIWGQYNQRWRMMSNRGSVTDNHKDHVHFTFTWNGALQRSAYWTGSAKAVHRGPCARYRGHYATLNVDRLAQRSRTSRCPAPRPIPSQWRYGPSVMYWQADRRVFWLQQFLAEQGYYSGPVNGSFGSVTYDAVRRYQGARGLGTTGVWDPATQNSSGRVVDRRTDSTVAWDATPVTAVVGQEIAVTATVAPVTGPPRVFRVERRPLGGTWALAQSGTTDASGTAAVVITTREGDNEYRVVAARTSYAAAGRSEPKLVSVPVSPAPTPTPAPSDTSSPSPTASEPAPAP
jgi:peptidoglycan hydrolase-like protein with peptidoglycan-binding domain